jgi:hypothetical protein
MQKDAGDYAQPPTGTFDSNYYSGTTYGLAAGEAWKNAQNSVLGYLPDLDVVGALVVIMIYIYMENIQMLKTRVFQIETIEEMQPKQLL